MDEEETKSKVGEILNDYFSKGKITFDEMAGALTNCFIEEIYYEVKEQLSKIVDVNSISEIDKDKIYLVGDGPKPVKVYLEGNIETREIKK